MGNESLDIDLIVREVVRQIRARMEGSSDTPQAGSLVLDTRLITLAELEGKLQDVRQVVIAPRAIMTPSARDELRDHNIEIVRQPCCNATDGE